MNYIITAFVFVFFLFWFVVFAGHAIRGCDALWDDVSDMPVPFIIGADGDVEDDNNGASPFDEGRKAGQKFIDDLKNETDKEKN